MQDKSKIYTSAYDIELIKWDEYNLRLPSVVRVHKVASLEIALIESKIGKVDPVVKESIKNVFVKLLDL